MNIRSKLKGERERRILLEYQHGINSNGNEKRWAMGRLR
jgi:hypothetical protein